MSSTCVFCRAPNPKSSCPLCSDAICRGCMEEVPTDMFAFQSELADELKHGRYCPRCFDSTVAPAIEKYNETLAAAREVGCWSKTFRGKVPVLKKAREEISVADCRDKKEALLRLAFRAREQGFNGLIRIEIKERKVRDEGYQKMLWTGTGHPCLVDEARLEREAYYEELWENTP